MKYPQLLFITFILCLSSAWAFPISKVSLSKQFHTAGELLEVDITTAQDFALETNGGVHFYLGFIESNIFVPGHPLNKSSRPISEHIYRISDLQINPWAYPALPLYRVEQLVFYEKQTLKEYVLWAGESTYHFVEQGRWVDSQIPVLTFSVLPNPNFDLTPPRVTELELTEHDESFDVIFSAHDDVSGFSETEFVAVLLPHQNIINHPVKRLGRDRFMLQGLRVEFPERIPDLTKIPVALMLSDRSGNVGGVFAESGRMNYVDAQGVMTPLPVRYLGER